MLTLTIINIVVLIAVVILVIMRTSSSGNNDSMQQYIDNLQRSNRESIEHLKQSQQAQMQMLSDMHEQRIKILTQTWEKRLQQQQEISRLQFESLSETVLSHSMEQLRVGNSRQMESVLTPLKERIQSLSTLINQVNVNSTASQQALVTRIDQLSSLNRTLGEEAKSLTNALKGNTKVQGDWGETILKTILEKAGLAEGVNFKFQPGSADDGTPFRNEDGSLLRPDFIIELPDGRKVIIDSKVSLTAYVDYNDADNDQERAEHGKRHINSVKKHINELATKKYQKVVKGAMEHVLMFIPNEGAYLAAMTIEPDIWAYAAERKVVIVSPAHLLSTIQLISQLWRQERQNRNAAEIARVAGLIHDSLVDFSGRLDKVGESIRASERCYEETRRFLDEDNARSIARRTARLKELGAKTH